MADINQVITVGVGTPSDIEHLILVGLNANPSVAVYYQPTIRAEFLPAVLTHEIETQVQLIDLDAAPLGISVGIDFPSDITWENAATITWENGSTVEWANTVTSTPTLHEVRHQ